MTPEGKVVAHVKKLTKTYGGECRKVEWSGRRGAPDLLIMLPGFHFFVEVKAPGQTPRPEQLREHERMRKGGFRVYVVDCKQQADEVFRMEKLAWGSLS